MPPLNNLPRPGRTLGVSLAILASVMLFSVFPLLQLAMLLIINFRFRNVDLPVPGQEGTVAPIAVGGDFTGVANEVVVIQAVIGVVYLVIAFFAWRGRPRWIRFAMLAAVVAMTLVTVAFSISPLFTQPDLSQGIDSGEALRRTLLSSQLVISILVALYVVWYMNRGPARAYYRGYYLPDPDETARPKAKR
jgi:hypothetical protein